MLCGPLDGLLDGAARAGRHLVVGGGHPLVEPDDERIQRNAHPDDPHHRDPDVDEAEREQERVRGHDEPEPEIVQPVGGDVDEGEQDLDGERDEHHPDRLDREPEQLAETAPGDEDDDESDATDDGDGDHAAPPYNGGSRIPTMLAWRTCATRSSVRSRE